MTIPVAQKRPVGFPDHSLLDLARTHPPVVLDDNGGIVPALPAVVGQTLEEIHFVEEDRKLGIKRRLGVADGGESLAPKHQERAHRLGRPLCLGVVKSGEPVLPEDGAGKEPSQPAEVAQNAEEGGEAADARLRLSIRSDQTRSKHPDLRI